jgi:hypothetical protein
LRRRDDSAGRAVHPRERCTRIATTAAFRRGRQFQFGFAKAVRIPRFALHLRQIEIEKTELKSAAASFAWLAFPALSIRALYNAPL